MSNVQYPPGYLEEYRGQIPVGLAIAFLVVETICVSLRFYARKIGKVRWGLDDTLIIPGFILCVAICACTIADVVHGGIGHHEAAVALTAPGKLIVFAKFIIAVPLLYLAAVVFPKLAILAIYLRIFTQSRFRIACYILAAVLVANWIGSTVAGLLMCRPLRYLWDQDTPGGHCFDINAWFRWASLINILTDVAMLILPLPVIWVLHTSKNVKIGLTITFATGSIGLITSIIRFANFFTQNAEVDGTYSAVDLFIWTLCESGMYLIAACLPTYRPLARILWKDGSLAPWLFRRSRTYLASRLTRTPKASRSSQWRAEDGSINIPLHSRQDLGFKRLQNGGDNPFSFPKVESTASKAEWGQADGPIVEEGIMVKQDMDVKGTKIDDRFS